MSHQHSRSEYRELHPHTEQDDHTNLPGKPQPLSTTSIIGTITTLELPLLHHFLYIGLSRSEVPPMEVPMPMPEARVVPADQIFDPPGRSERPSHVSLLLYFHCMFLEGVASSLYVYTLGVSSLYVYTLGVSSLYAYTLGVSSLYAYTLGVSSLYAYTLGVSSLYVYTLGVSSLYAYTLGVSSLYAYTLGVSSLYVYTLGVSSLYAYTLGVSSLYAYTLGVSSLYAYTLGVSSLYAYLGGKF